MAGRRRREHARGRIDYRIPNSRRSDPEFLELANHRRVYRLSATDAWRDSNLLYAALGRHAGMARSRVDMTVHGSDSAPASLLTIRNLIPTGSDYPARATFPGLIDQSGAPLAVDATILLQIVPGDRADPLKPVGQELNLTLQKAIFSNQAPIPQGQRLRLGALDLEFTGRNDDIQQSVFSVNFNSPAGSTPLTGAGPLVHFDLFFSLNDARPGGEDELPEGAPPVLTKPLLIAPVQSAPGSFTLEFHETTAAAANQQVNLNLTSKGQAGTSSRKLIVLDAEPFMVARVNLPKFLASDNSNRVASWNNSGLAGAGWEVATPPDQSFQLFLPPQGVGETMEKGTAADGFHDMEENQPADFRFSPTAVLTLRTTALTKSFTEPPWNLRRLLGYPGQETPGAPVVKIDFELLYGLSGTITHPFLRLAEIAARLGRTVDTTVPTPPTSFTKAQKDAFAASFKSWQERQARYATRLGVLEPWDIQQPATGLVLTDGIGYQLRGTARLKYPVPGNDGNPHHAPDGLAGGFAWPFESKNIYEQLWSAPASSSAKLANPYFSALGGWGFQKASFNNDLTTIYSNTTMGRTHYVSVERIGRVGVFWNTAKHVIVFERTVLRAEQFESDQDALSGRPVLRKVREYVEILQPERSYPEFGAAPSTCGFVLSTNCKSRVMNVDGAWGSDVNVTDANGKSRTGWQVPLWKPTANPVIYPKPHILLEVATDPVSGSASTLVEIDEPEKLYFFTSTDPGVDTHTDNWPAVPFVDYADFPQISAVPGFGNGMQDMPDDDPAFPDGFSKFTIAVKPGDRPANVVNQRSTKPVSANIRTVTMGRSALAPNAPNPPGARTTQALLAGLPDRINSTIEGLAIALKANTVASSTVKADITKIKADLATVQAAAKNVNGGAICNQIRQQAMKSVTLADAQVKDQILRAVHSLHAQIAAIVATAANDWSAIETPLSDLIKTTFQDLNQPLNTLIGTKDGLVHDLSKLPDSVVKPALDHVLDAISNDTDPLTVAALQHVQAAHANLLQVLSSLQTQTMTWSGNWLGNRANPISAALRDISGQVDSTFAGVETQLAAGVVQTKKTLSDQVDAVLTKVQNTVAQLNTDFNTVAGSPLDSLQAVLNGYQKQFQDWLSGHGSTNPSDYLAKLPGVLDSIETSVQNNLDNILTQVAIAAGNQAFQACSSLLPANEIDNAVSFVGGLLDRVSQVADVPVQIGSVIDRVRGSLNDQMTQFANRVAGLLPPATGFTVPDTTLQLFRAFGEPPHVPNLDFNGPQGARNAVSYLFDRARNEVSITPSLAGVFGGNTLADSLADSVQALGVSLPTNQILDQLIPPDLKSFDLSKILPSFAGLSLTNLFPGLKMPDLANKGVVVTHGLDPQSRRPWLEVDVNFPLAQSANVFSFGPLALTLVSAQFQAQVRIDSTTSPPSQTVNGKLSGNWGTLRRRNADLRPRRYVANVRSGRPCPVQYFAAQRKAAGCAHLHRGRVVQGEFFRLGVLGEARSSGPTFTSILAFGAARYSVRRIRYIQSAARLDIRPVDEQRLHDHRGTAGRAPDGSLRDYDFHSGRRRMGRRRRRLHARRHRKGRRHRNAHRNDCGARFDRHRRGRESGHLAGTDQRRRLHIFRHRCRIPVHERQRPGYRVNATDSGQRESARDRGREYYADA